ncbi:hypothetical protein HC864_02005 [Candidatus Gracilibacteria bacterium]|nr:hypothetical protein [Candidatus Gracilibacteria bacterium]
MLILFHGVYIVPNEDQTCDPVDVAINSTNPESSVEYTLMLESRIASIENLLKEGRLKRITYGEWFLTNPLSLVFTQHQSLLFCNWYGAIGGLNGAIGSLMFGQMELIGLYLY